jgi:hypothetical protein
MAAPQGFRLTANVISISGHRHLQPSLCRWLGRLSESGLSAAPRKPGDWPPAVACGAVKAGAGSMKVKLKAAASDITQPNFCSARTLAIKKAVAHTASFNPPHFVELWQTLGIFSSAKPVKAPSLGEVFEHDTAPSFCASFSTCMAVNLCQNHAPCLAMVVFLFSLLRSFACCGAIFLGLLLQLSINVNPSFAKVYTYIATGIL